MHACYFWLQFIESISKDAFKMEITLLKQILRCHAYAITYQKMHHKMEFTLLNQVFKGFWSPVFRSNQYIPDGPCMRPSVIA